MTTLIIIITYIIWETYDENEQNWSVALCSSAGRVNTPNRCRAEAPDRRCLTRPALRSSSPQLRGRWKQPRPWKQFAAVSGDPAHELTTRMSWRQASWAKAQRRPSAQASRAPRLKERGLCKGLSSPAADHREPCLQQRLQQRLGRLKRLRRDYRRLQEYRMRALTQVRTYEEVGGCAEASKQAWRRREVETERETENSRC